MTPWLSPLFFYLALFLLPLVISWLLTALLIRLAPRFGLFDDPGARKVHRKRTPRGGGLAIYVAMLASEFCFFHGGEGHAFPVLALGLIIMLLGLIDDMHPLPWQLRLAVQMGVAIVAVLTLSADLPWYVRLGAILWIVGLTNAFNMLDNMDALSAGVAWIVAALLFLVPLVRQADARDYQAALPYLTLMGALSGFLWFNRPPARIFMGDAGSTFLGFFLGVSSLESTLGAVTVPHHWAVPLCILAVPWYDLLSVVGLRLRQGRSPFQADKQHLSHRLVRLGLKSPMAVCIIYLLTLATGAGGLLLCLVSYTGAFLVGIELACWWAAVAAIEYVSHYRSSHG
jgi:UDP-GlcNAc:undecaprenyl-phosphate GlcNAc-1-phosphate transferase